ncbi:hypothetical protein BT96DRAFT_1094787 [Gymnopus androsaceus JB14]|uniref:Uncharacterized protein n=1 Tax=Gymnopus androsaceus JB14 TaxID=1447944 RepID=A0A6A4GHM5_9AGAR|nr:hypothetical protein BT96DRAFT_1094787 [Gymnopus androsaceus JB14]
MKIRNQVKKDMPYPSQLNGIDCCIEIPKEAVTQLCEFLEEDTGVSREECFRWYSNEFAQTASTTWESIGKPAVNFGSAWDVFAQMAPLILQKYSSSRRYMKYCVITRKGQPVVTAAK